MDVIYSRSYRPLITYPLGQVTSQPLYHPGKEMDRLGESMQLDRISPFPTGHSGLRRLALLCSCYESSRQIYNNNFKCEY